jgi:hypothetical protein
MIFWWSSGSSRGAVTLAVLGLVIGLIFSGILFGRVTSVSVIGFGGLAFFFALPLLLFMSRSKAEAAQAARDAAEKDKPKHGESLSELMSILNDEDIDDLRARVKARLEEQIDRADPDEMETFADLLDETKRKRR